MSGLASRPAADGSSPNRASVFDGARLTTVREVGPCREVCLTRERRVRSAQRVRPSRRAPTGTSAHRAYSASRPCGCFALGPRRTPRYTAVRSRRVCPSDRSRAVRLRRGAVRSRSHGARCDADDSRYHRRPGRAFPGWGEDHEKRSQDSCHQKRSERPRLLLGSRCRDVGGGCRGERRGAPDVYLASDLCRQTQLYAPALGRSRPRPRSHVRHGRVSRALSPCARDDECEPPVGVRAVDAVDEPLDWPDRTHRVRSALCGDVTRLCCASGSRRWDTLGPRPSPTRR